jgi:hypothetical protein
MIATATNNKIFIAAKMEMIRIAEWKRPKRFEM